ncbi:MAG TPA: hypothetical protein VJR92_01165 [Gemmatimonadaceae bacterium]|nr:hypothetical protein [Gemmatimonadaceae bacterium]
MTVDLQQLESRIRSLESTTKRWRVFATALCAAAVAIAATAFRPMQSAATIDAQRITLRSEGLEVGRLKLPASRMEMSLDRGGSLRLQYFSDSVDGQALSRQRPELRILDANGREVARLGDVAFRLLTK